MPNDPPTQRYKFVIGTGDANHEATLNQAAGQDGFRATMMVFDTSGRIVVLMEKET